MLLRQSSLRLNNNLRVNQMMPPRCFGAAARKTFEETSTEVENADLIRDYIKGLMSQQEDDVVLKPISDDDLEQRLEHFQVSRVVESAR